MQCTALCVLRLLAEVNEECGQGYVSSSSDGEDVSGSAATPRSRWTPLRLQSSVDVSDHPASAVRDTFAPKTTDHTPQTSKTLPHAAQMTG